MTVVQCYDASIGHQLSSLAGVREVKGVYQAYPTSPEKYNTEALGHVGFDVMLDYEPTILPEYLPAGPLDPKLATLLEIWQTHKYLYDAIELIKDQAKTDNIRIGVYQWFEHTPGNQEFILSNPGQYFTNVKRTARLEVYPGRSVRNQLRYLGGVNYSDNYVPDEWNNSTWGLQKFLVCCERKATALESAGVPSVPMICPYTVGEASNSVNAAIVRAWLLWARYRYGENYAVWSDTGGITAPFIALLEE